MNDATKLRIRRELAERMGLPKCPLDDKCWIIDGNHTEFDPFISHEDCTALVAWLAEHGEAIQHKFVTCLMDALTGEGWHMVRRGSGMSVHHIMKVLTSPLEVRVLAACAALGIGTEDE